MNRAILFNRERVRHLERLADRPRRLRGSQLLWVDVEQVTREDIDQIASVFELDQETRVCLEKHSVDEEMVFYDAGRYIHVTTYVPDEGDEGELIALECVVSENWVVTVHEAPIPVLAEFADRVSGSGDTGSLDGPGFLAALLEWVLGAYSAAFERIEERLEEFDIQAMRGDAEAERDIEQLVQMRSEVGNLRRALAGHRFALVSLTHPELEALGDHNSSDQFQSLLTRFEATAQEARDARDAIVGSFDVLIARGGHRTNEIMKVLTLTSVILLPGALVAGVMGMNFKVGLFDHPDMFWAVVAVIALVAPITLGAAKHRNWI
jgi:magnesium transporter